MARGRISGFGMDGGQTVSTVGISSTTRVQRSFPSCTVTVYLTGTTTLATIYADMAGTPKANPFTAATDGYWFFYADSRVDVKFSGGGITTPFTLGDLSPGEEFNVLDASQMSGADGGARINAADAALGAGQGEIWVNQNLPAITTNISISTGHTLRFVQPGTYGIGAAGAGVAISLATGSYIYGSGLKKTILQANAGFTGTMIKTTAAVTSGDNGVQGLILMGQFLATVGIEFTGEAGGFLRDLWIFQVNSANNTNPANTAAAGGSLYIHDTQGLVMENITVGQSGGDGVRIVDSWGITINGLFAERPAYNALGPIVGGKGAALSFVRNTEASTVASSVIVNGLHIEWEPEAADARDAVLIDGYDYVEINTFSMASTNANSIVNFVRMINTNATTLHLGFSLRNLRMIQGGVTNFVNDQVTGRTLATGGEGRLFHYSSTGQGGIQGMDIVAGNPTGQEVVRGVWHLSAAAAAPLILSQDSSGKSYLYIRGNSAKYWTFVAGSANVVSDGVIATTVTTNQFVTGLSPNATTLNFPAPAGAITLAFPNTADTMVARATTDTLTNKTINMGGKFNYKQGLTLTGATPSVSGGNWFTMTQGGATNVTNFTGGTDGQELVILFGDSNSTLIQGAGVLQLAGQVSFNPQTRTIMSFINNGGTWWEKSRSVN